MIGAVRPASAKRSAVARAKVAVRRPLSQVATRNVWWLAGPLFTFLPTAVMLGKASLWEDEVQTVVAISRPWREIIRLVQVTDAPHGAYYGFLHFWTKVFGESEFALRLPSLLAMTVAAALVSVLAARIAGRRAGLLAGVAFAVFPATAIYGAMARPYGFVVMFAALALLTAQLAVTRGGWRWWMLHLVSLIGVAYSSVIGLAIAPGIGIFMLASRDIRKFGMWIAALAGTIVIAWPLVELTRAQAGLQGWVPETTLWDIPRIFGETASRSSAITWSIVGGGVAAGLLRRRGAFLVWAALASPPILVGIMSLVLYPTLITRYVLVLLPALAVLAGAAFGRGRGRWIVVPAMVLLAVVAIPERRAHFEMASFGADFRAAAAVVSAQFQPGDAVVYGGEWGIWRNGLNYYLAGEKRPVDVMLSAPAADTGTLYASVRPAAELEANLLQYSRVWLVEPTGRSMTHVALAGLMAPGGTTSVDRIDVTLFRR